MNMLSSELMQGVVVYRGLYYLCVLNQFPLYALEVVRGRVHGES